MLSVIKHKKELCVVIIACVLIFIHFAIYEQFLPMQNGLMGHDFNNYLPYFLDGYYWFSQNGLFSLQWFTPSFCGGIPKFPNPVSIYFSIPQFLVFIVDPITSVRITFLLFAALGFIGFYLLARKIFLLSMYASFLGASIFLFNDFYAHKYIVGHMTYHTFMLMPLITYLILRNAEKQTIFYKDVLLEIFSSALLIAYLFYLDIAYISVPTFVFIIFCLLIYAIQKNSFLSLKLPMVKLSMAGMLASGIFAAKLSAALSFLDSSNREHYPLPGAENIGELISLVVKNLFLSPQHEMASEILINRRWALGQHEFEFGITFVPAIILAIGSLYLLKKFTLRQINISKTQLFLTLLLLVLFSLPIAFNFYTPEWNATLKQIPLFKNSSSLVRWFCLYIPFLCLFTSLLFEKINLNKKQQFILISVSIIMIVSLKIWKDRDYYYQQNYNPSEVLQAYSKVQSGSWTPTITENSTYVNEKNQAILTISRNNMLAHGKSQVFCYEAIFGYALENLPFKTLSMGEITIETDNVLNIKNPACYVFPKENKCEAGDHFRIKEKNQALAFSKFQSFAFEISTRQAVANKITLLSMLAVILILLAYCLLSIKKSFTYTDMQ